MVPETGDFATLAAENEGRMLVRNANGIEVLSNVCRHRQALMFNGRGNANNIVCPLHRWTYDLKGELIGAPHFPETPCLNLSKTPLQKLERPAVRAERLQRDGKAEPDLSVTKDLDFSGYMFDHVEVHECDYNWKTFIEVYLEDYHVEPFHPGLGSFVSCDDLRWEFGDDYSVQTVGVNRGLQKAGSPAYKKLAGAGAQVPRRRSRRRTARSGSRCTRTSWSSGIRTCWSSRPCGPMVRKRRATWSSSTTPKRSCCSSANSSRPNAPPTWKPASRTMKSPSAWMPAARS